MYSSEATILVVRADLAFFVLEAVRLEIPSQRVCCLPAFTGVVQLLMLLFFIRNCIFLLLRLDDEL